MLQLALREGTKTFIAVSFAVPISVAISAP